MSKAKLPAPAPVRKLLNVGECIEEFKRIESVLIDEANALRYAGNHREAMRLTDIAYDVAITRIEYMREVARMKLARGARIQVTRILTSNFDFDGPIPEPWSGEL